ncbi:MAG: alkaline phosphatase family protein [Planctomycetales bacterium]|nr:alkaline phosphatase family protein [Planctomycetales bacterium]
MNRPRATTNRRRFLQGSTLAGAAGLTGLSGCSYWSGSNSRVSRAAGKKVIIIGIDGMDPRLCSQMMSEGLLPNMAKLRATGGFSELGTSVPPQSPVAWANFINGNGPGTHGIFDFIHRHPHEQCAPFYSAAETVPGEGAWEVGDYQLQLDFWPFNHKPSETVLRRQGVPFWDYLDASGIPTTFYDLPSNYPPSPSQYGHHRCICGMGTPDMAGSYGTYQYFAENGPPQPIDEGGGRRTRIKFDEETGQGELIGPENGLLKVAKPMTIPFKVHRDLQSNAVAIDLPTQRLVLKPGQWSPWIRLNFEMTTPAFLPDKEVSGICRILVQEVAPIFRMYVSPINVDPRAAVVQLSEPESFIGDVANHLGPFYTTGFKEDHKARTNGVFNDDEFVRQATNVMEERLALFDYAVQDYEDGLLFFYFSSSDLQSHMFWWNSDKPHPIRSTTEAQKWHGYIRRLYQRLDQVVGDIYDRYGSQATIIVMSDHGFSEFGRQFNLNSWLRWYGYLGPPECTSLFKDVDWSQTAAYGLGINGLYINLKGRERDGIIEPGEQKEALIQELIFGLTQLQDEDGRQVVRNVYRSDQVYSGDATELAPDLIVGYARGYRASWATCLGDLTDDVLLDNDQAWSADHCADALEVPGILFSNRKITDAQPSLVDLAPSILKEFGLKTPATMSGKVVLG